MTDLGTTIDSAATKMAVASAGAIERMVESSSPARVDETAISSLGATIISGIVEHLEIIKNSKELDRERITASADRLTNETNIELIALCIEKLTQASRFIQSQ